MAKVLIVYHTLSGNTEKMAQAFVEGAKSVQGTEVLLKKALDATLEDLLGCDAIAFGSADYFSYIAGALKDFFDRTYYPSQGKVTGKPMLPLLPAEEGVGRLFQRWIDYATHSNLRKLLEEWQLRGHPPLNPWQNAKRPEKNWRLPPQSIDISGQDLLAEGKITNSKNRKG